MASFSSCSGVIGKDSDSLAKRPQKSQYWPQQCTSGSGALGSSILPDNYENAVTASAAGRECSTSAIPLRATEVQDLISKGYLDEDQRHNEEATRAAVLGLLHRAMEDGWLYRALNGRA
jgi:hypothetical protein